ncbi:universal stress protein [Flavilitoribacter nigricans]|uniref:UspA domain-containing protein n=1 Tax=Flavilitoribacter nigricans (strain ATCC 23147 / DSM 23189 / NBRC 102662 / NCIMB 1420 / SS-2) TaxID=1122177 RepID=A0A2D0MZQ0_FLAN2|nr:universal stress protein [Flavilitoribacter nigricans]PHN01697.1 hypothetical protein CRP01_35715 [Flavilitoribacter nigricans DSM 23189 = NBRC 102662]
MKATRKILVALDAGQFEESLQKHTALFANKLGARQILGVHIVPVLKIADSVTVDARHPLSPAAPAVEMIRERVAAQTDVLKKCCQHAEVGIAIREGQPYQSLVRLADEMDADLLIMSRKKASSGSGITSRKIARKVSSDLLFVPERISTTIENILVAVDFSENSARAVEKALYLADQLHLQQAINVLNIVDIPPLNRIGDLDVYHLAGKSVLEISQERYEHFLEKYDIDRSRLNPIFVESWDEDLGLTIRSTAHELGADLVVLGAHGHSALQRFFLGSVTENLVELDKQHLIWIIR